MTAEGGVPDRPGQCRGPRGVPPVASCPRDRREWQPRWRLSCCTWQRHRRPGPAGSSAFAAVELPRRSRKPAGPEPAQGRCLAGLRRPVRWPGFVATAACRGFSSGPARTLHRDGIDVAEELPVSSLFRHCSGFEPDGLCSRHRDRAQVEVEARDEPTTGFAQRSVDHSGQAPASRPSSAKAAEQCCRDARGR